MIRRKGSAEDECSYGAAKYAKIRPMRVEMGGMNWNQWLGKNLRQSNSRDVACNV